MNACISESGCVYELILSVYLELIISVYSIWQRLSTSSEAVGFSY